MKKAINIKRIVFICLIIIALLVAAIALRVVVETNFSYNNPVFTGYGFHTNEDIQKITDDDLGAVTSLLDDYHISYKIQNNGTRISVQGYKWGEAAAILTNCGLEFDGCVIA